MPQVIMRTMVRGIEIEAYCPKGLIPGLVEKIEEAATAVAESNVPDDEQRGAGRPAD